MAQSKPDTYVYKGMVVSYATTALVYKKTESHFISMLSGFGAGLAFGRLTKSNFIEANDWGAAVAPFVFEFTFNLNELRKMRKQFYK